MVIHQGCPQTPGERIHALGFASTRTRGRRRGPIPAMCQCDGSMVFLSIGPPVLYRCPPSRWIRGTMLDPLRGHLLLDRVLP